MMLVTSPTSIMMGTTLNTRALKTKLIPLKKGRKGHFVTAHNIRAFVYIHILVEKE